MRCRNENCEAREEKGAKVNEKRVQTRNEASNICTQVMIMNEAASTRFSEQVKIEHEAYMRSYHGLSMKFKVTSIKKIRKMIEKWVNR